MKIKKVIIGFLISLIALSFTNCSKDENNPVAPEKKEPAKLQVKEVQVPQHLSQVQDPHAQLVVGFVQLANGFKNYTPFFTPPSGATHVPKTNGVKDEWTWTSQGLTVRLVYNEGTESVSWKIYLTGVFEGFTVNNWLAGEAEQNKDGTSGHLMVYDPPTSNVLTEWSWNTQSDGTYIFVVNMYDSDEKIELTVNPDNSGTIQFYNSVDNTFVLEYKITWTSAGSGQWWEYDTAGNVVSQGSWT